jgi:hypothetical protein
VEIDLPYPTIQLARSAAQMADTTALIMAAENGNLNAINDHSFNENGNLNKVHISNMYLARKR